MRRYCELNVRERERAFSRAQELLLTAICEGGVRFVDELNGNALQARIDAAIAKANAMHTPWFAGEYIMDTCAKEIDAMAWSNAEDAYYPDNNDLVIRL
jgi:hypothetical protein